MSPKSIGTPLEEVGGEGAARGLDGGTGRRPHDTAEHTPVRSSWVPQEPPRRGWRRRAVIGLIIFVIVTAIVALVYVFALPRVFEAYIRGKVEDLAARSGREITFDGFELERLNKYSFYDLVVTDPRSPEVFLQVERLTVTLDRARLFTGQATIRGIEVDSPTVFLRDFPDGTSNYAELQRRIEEALGLAEPEPGPAEPGPAPPEPPREPRESPFDELLGGRIPSVRIVGARLDVTEANAETRPPQVERLGVEVVPGEEGYACSFELQADVEPIEADMLARPVRHIQISGSVDPADEQGDVMVRLGEPIELQEIPGLPDLLLRVNEVGFEYPYTFRLRGVEILARQTRNPVLLAPEVVVSLRELTADPERLFISLFRADGLRLFVEMDRDGNTNIDRLLGIRGPGPLTALVPRDVAPETPPEDPTPSSGQNAAPEQESPFERQLRRRKWWEIAPQTTELNDVRMEIVVREDDGTPIRTLDLSIPRISAAQRLLNFQMDVSTHIDLTERGTGPVGALDVEFVYYYMTKHWALELGYDAIDLARVIDVFPYPNPFEIRGGQLDGSLSLADERPQRDLSLSGELALTDFAFTAASFDTEPISDVDASYAFALAVDGEDNMTMSRGHVTFGKIEADVLLDLRDLDLEELVRYLVSFKDDAARQPSAENPDPLPFTEARLRVEMPRQPAMDVFESFPVALRRRLEGTEMTGEVGWRLDATALFERDEDGQLEVEIPRPSTADVLDEDLELVSLPPELDVRVLATDWMLPHEPYSFVFVDGIGESRHMTIGPDNPRWVPLLEISPWMVLSILNTEDQGFYQNQGFNWTQMRRVIGQFLQEREFGRGASTISMQLIKNVFLSRERLLSRKTTEMFLTYWMNRYVPKDRILEVYLNIIEFGPGINGIAEAAEHYFGRLPIDLTIAEATWLVTIVPNPRAYHFYWEQGAITERWWNHMTRYIDRLHTRELITEEQWAEAIAAGPPEFYKPEPGDPPLRPAPPPAIIPADFVIPFMLDEVGGVDPMDPPLDEIPVDP